jgi:adenylosuccinate synthase
MSNHCLYGGHYGSEGKGSLAESFAKVTKASNRKLAVLGENSPNSGHTCSLGKTRNVPASAFYADTVLMGPDSAIDPAALTEDLTAITQVTGKCPRVYIHQHAALVTADDRDAEQSSGVVTRVSSTGSGSGAARAYRKCYLRSTEATLGHYLPDGSTVLGFPDMPHVSLLSHWQYFTLIEQLKLQRYDLLFECSQGTLLDVNWGRYPFCTSRSTLARVAIERNGLGELDWTYCGVYRTYPIRTGGPSGPTGGAEITFADINQENEIATVTKRVRRIFEFDPADFLMSVRLNRPQVVAFTHLDYLNLKSPRQLLDWLASEHSVHTADLYSLGVRTVMSSYSIGHFHELSL